MSDETTTALSTTSGPLGQVLDDVLKTVPGAEEDPTPRMMAFILESDSAQQWDLLFESANVKDNVGRKIRVHTLRQAPSSFEGRLGFFLIADVTWLDTGEESVISCSSEIAVAQLLNCWKRDDLPHDFEIIAKDKPTRRGFIPIRLRSMGRVVTPAEAS